ncbi:YeeE/YedE family protein [Stenotrophomonas pavanii]|uniref:YeeE/YedE family protein n=1 Tax=Stenotrophomonas pavanii TaxID=487698 RepID=A0A246KUT7_9GAMM|nr:YeeE/YedE thiosulfate transporter family protein [Stenotrophomonas pavanii]MBH1625959.1 YeeE/YedE family protein [Stenotrophomonas maltophilia]KRG79860.1 YeeE/YedE family protein [Stenotrophomonas pavanii]MBN4940823.1 YeeE/YedE family protein [Stenotrophomonas maltophilia]MBN5057622.1 YeeE/YedE family protein [Stenotrophomonas maltophilia]MBN5066260.1 YeeE/YedE family protein [Stenotrophomonas maltophilia]
MNLPWAAVAGGAMIGAAAVLLLATTGRVAGVSGIAAGSLRAEPEERAWRWAFLLGLAAAAAAVLWWQAPPGEAPRALLRDALPAWQLVGAGVLVGVGTRLGNGCTSGHGVCGMARGSKRSVLAVLVFMACAMLTTFLIRHGGGPG